MVSLSYVLGKRRRFDKYLRDDPGVCKAAQHRQQGGRLIRPFKGRQQGALSQLVVVVRRVQRANAAHCLVEIPTSLILLQQRLRTSQLSKSTWEGQSHADLAMYLNCPFKQTVIASQKMPEIIS